MNFAWSTVALLLFLLPGFLFFVGIYLPENFTRETAQRSALGQLAGTVLISLVVHGTLFLLLDNFSIFSLPSPSLTHVFAALQLSGSSVTAEHLARNIQEHAGAIFAYLLFSSAAGIGLGYTVGQLTLSGSIGFLSQHGWVYELQVEGSAESVTFAHVLTDVKHGDDRLLYRGILKHFNLSPDGRFSYLVLTSAERSYLHLRADGAEVGRHVHRIGHAPAGMIPAADTWYNRIRNRLFGRWSPAPDRRAPAPIFVVEGEDITNVFFERRLYTMEDAEIAPRVVDILNRWAAAQAGIASAAEAGIASAESGKPPDGMSAKLERQRKLDKYYRDLFGPSAKRTDPPISPEP